MAVDPHCFDAKNGHPPWQNSRYAPGRPLIPIPHLFLKIIVITIFFLQGICQLQQQREEQH
jgi:hypothetical protein